MIPFDIMTQQKKMMYRKERVKLIFQQQSFEELAIDGIVSAQVEVLVRAHKTNNQSHKH